MQNTDIFPNTAASLVHQMQDDPQAALQRIIRDYRRPIEILVRRNIARRGLASTSDLMDDLMTYLYFGSEIEKAGRGASGSPSAKGESQDNSSEPDPDRSTRVYFEQSPLADYDASKGLFRAYLTTIVKRFLSKRFRESAQSTQLSGVSIHGDDELSDMELPVEGQQDAELERAWAQSILEAAFAELERDRPGDWLLLSLHYGLAGRSAHNLDELAERLGKKKGTLSTALHTLRQERLLPSILRRLGTGCSRKNYDEEKMWLLSELLKAQPDLGRDLEFEDMA